ELNAEKRKQLYHQAQKILVEDGVPFIPLYTAIQNFLMKPSVKGYIVNPMQEWRYSDVYLERDK
ncbi:MAG TPA: peptide ABC transporter substrate-binding protein, partial [Bdellovibrionota bacterium]|nr:peptide ABC transporter substrate-binding protein [Bdellovibrionota bacterium]